MQATVALREREAQNATEVAKRRILMEAKRGEEAAKGQLEAEKAVAAARDGKRKARERLREQQAKILEHREQMREAQSETFDKRVSAVMQLKESLDEARRHMAAKNTLLQIRHRQRREEEDARFNDLLEDGQNPYEAKPPAEQRRDPRPLVLSGSSTSPLSLVPNIGIYFTHLNFQLNTTHHQQC
jgi:hypothetical protein